MKTKYSVMTAVLCTLFIECLLAAVGSHSTWTLGTTPGNPAAGKITLWANTATGNLECLTSAGNTCLPPFTQSYTSARYYTPIGSIISTLLLSDATEFGTPIYITSTSTYDRIGINVTSASGSGGVVRLGIYSDSGSRCPGNLLLDAGTVSVSATGWKEATISQSLTGGNWYWLSAVSQLGPSPQPTVTATGGDMVLPSGGTTGEVAAAVSSLARGGISGALTNFGGCGSAVGLTAGVRIAIRKS